MSLTPEEMKKQKKERKGVSVHFLSALLFLLFGVILILKLSGVNYPPFGYIPDKLLYWTVAVGCTFGGLYMIYKGYLWRQRIVVR